MANVLIDALRNVDTVAIGGHVRPDGDCVGSCMGLYNYIRDNYPCIKTDVYLEPVPEVYCCVHGTNQIITRFDGQGKAYDLFIALDCGDYGRLGKAAGYFETANRKLCIDHHVSNQAFADINEIRPWASSTSEVLFDLMDEEKISLEVANCLYMGIMCDTGCFKHSNTKEHTLNIAGKLITKGVNSSKMMDEVFYQKTFMQNRLLGQCLLNSFLTLDNQCIVSIVTQQLLDEYGAVSSDLEGVIDQLRVTKGVEVAVLLTEDKNGGCKISMRSCEYADVAAVASCFGGGGHVRAAGATVSVKPEAILDSLLVKIKGQLMTNV